MLAGVRKREIIFWRVVGGVHRCLPSNGDHRNVSAYRLWPGPCPISRGTRAAEWPRRDCYRWPEAVAKVRGRRLHGRYRCLEKRPDQCQVPAPCARLPLARPADLSCLFFLEISGHWPGGCFRSAPRSASPDPTPIRFMIDMASTIAISSGLTRSAGKYMTLPDIGVGACGRKTLTHKSVS